MSLVCKVFELVHDTAGWFVSLNTVIAVWYIDDQIRDNV